jgi:hypothetical protein
MSEKSTQFFVFSLYSIIVMEKDSLFHWLESAGISSLSLFFVLFLWLNREEELKTNE